MTKSPPWEQLPLPFGRPRARNTDPHTSHDAAASLTPEQVRRSQAAVLLLLRVRGPMTDTELVRAYCDEPRQSPSGLRTRRAELVAQGKVFDTGLRARLASGRRAIVWAATEGIRP